MTLDPTRPKAPPPRRRGAIAALLLAASVALSLGIAEVNRRHHAIRLGYALSVELERTWQLEEENRRLRLEHSMLRHPDRIERYAVRLGLQRPDPEQIRAVDAQPLTRVASP